MRSTLACALAVVALTFTGGASARAGSPAAGAASPGATSPVAATDSSLRFLRDGAIVKTIDLPTLKRTCTVQTVEIDDPYYQARKAFLACPLRDVLELGFGPLGTSFDREDVFLRARDGYVKPATGARLREDGGFLAFADARRTDGTAPGWEPIDRRQVDPGPYYLVWAKPHQRDVHRYPWPYQLVAIEIASFATEYPHTLPRTAAPDSAPWARLRRLPQRVHRLPRHQRRRRDGRPRPERAAEHRRVPAGRADQGVHPRPRNVPLHQHARAPASLGRQLDELIAYFTVMKALKHDPGRAP